MHQGADAEPSRRASEPTLLTRDERYARRRFATLRYWTKAHFCVTLAGGLYGSPFLIIGVYFGLALAWCVGAALVIPFAVGSRMLTGTARHPLAAPAFGGTVGFFATAPIWDSFLASNRQPFSWAIFILGPMVTTLLGQLAGYFAARKEFRAFYRTRSDFAGTWRFSVRGMLVLTAWCAVLLSVLQSWGWLTPTNLTVALAWLPWQLLLLRLMRGMGRSRVPRDEVAPLAN
jgi:hypothetical protein